MTPSPRPPTASPGSVELSDRGCETCHGPAKGHVEDPDDAALIPSFDALSAQQQARTCQQCHAGGEQLFWHEGVHARRGVTCSTCHSVHHPVSETHQLRAVSAEVQCFECHRDVRAETWKRSHHPIREGKIGCADCHNPHGSNTEKMIREVSVNEQCYTCHTEKRGPFLWEHPPVRENCLNCHTPHGSNHFKLQKTSVPFICQQCHSNTRHPGTMYDGATLADSLTAVQSRVRPGLPELPRRRPRQQPSIVALSGALRGRPWRNQPGFTTVLLGAAFALAIVQRASAHETDEFHFHIDPLIFEVLEVDVDTDSSKFNEYRDIQSGFNLPALPPVR